MLTIPGVPIGWMPDIAGSLVGGCFSAAVALLVVYMTRASDRRRLEFETRARCAEEMQRALATFLHVWVTNEDYVAGKWRATMFPAYLNAYVSLLTAAPGVREQKLVLLVEESHRRLLQPAINTITSMVKEEESASSEYSQLELKTATKEIDHLVGAWAQSFFDLLSDWRQSHEYRDVVHLDKYSHELSEVQRNLRSSVYAQSRTS